MKKKSINRIILIIAIVGVLISSAFILNGILQKETSQSQSPSYDATFAVREITDNKQFLAAPEGFYDFFCSRGCSGTDPITRQLIFNHYDDIINNEPRGVYFAVVSKSPVAFKLISTGGLPSDYNIREVPFADDGFYSFESRTGRVDYNYNNQINRNKYVYLVRVDYIPKISGIDYPGSSFINVKLGGVNSPTLADAFTIEIHRDATIKRGFEFVYN